MTITSSLNVVTITGNIKTIRDYQNIKSTVDAVASSQKNIVINIKESISVTSSIIGYFNKLVLKDKILLQLNIGNQELVDLLNDLNLTSIFKVKKV